MPLSERVKNQRQRLSEESNRPAIYDGFRKEVVKVENSSNVVIGPVSSVVLVQASVKLLKSSVLKVHMSSRVTLNNACVVGPIFMGGHMPGIVALVGGRQGEFPGLAAPEDQS